MSSIFYDQTYVFSHDFKSEKNLTKIFSNFSTVPIFIIRFAILVHQRESENVILEIIKNDSSECDDLIDCIVTSSHIKLCTLPVFKSICKDVCVCTKHPKYNRLYNKLLKELKKRNNRLTESVFSNNLADMIKQTGSYTEKFYDIINGITDKNRDNDVGVIDNIVKANLFGKKYLCVLNKIIDKSDIASIINTCVNVKKLIIIHNERCSLIKDNIYVSDIKFADNTVSLMEEGFTHVVSLTRKDITKSTNVVYNHINIPDKATINFIDEVSDCVAQLLLIPKNSKILCHCFSGISRSVLFASVLITYKYGMEFDDALNIVKNNREISDPNPELVIQISERLSLKND